MSHTQGKSVTVSQQYRNKTPQVNILSMAIGTVLDRQIREHEHAAYKRAMQEQVGRQQKAVMARHAAIQENIRVQKLNDDYNARLAEYEESVARGETPLTKPIAPAGLMEQSEGFKELADPEQYVEKVAALVETQATP